jgi:hypothetical protein
MSSPSGRIFSLMLAGLSGLAGCGLVSNAPSAPPLPYQSHDEIEEGPPRLIGSDGDLEIAHGTMSGSLEGGAYNVQLTADAARGRGPMGPIDVHIKPVAQGFDLSGVWNGGDVHLVVGANGARGQVLKQISPEDRGYASCWYDIARSGAAGKYEGLSECLGDNGPRHFELMPSSPAALTEEQNAVLLLAYFAAPPPVQAL